MCRCWTPCTPNTALPPEQLRRLASVVQGVCGNGVRWSNSQEWAEGKLPSHSVPFGVYHGRSYFTSYTSHSTDGQCVISGATTNPKAELRLTANAFFVFYSLNNAEGVSITCGV